MIHLFPLLFIVLSLSLSYALSVFLPVNLSVSISLPQWTEALYLPQRQHHISLLKRWRHCTLSAVLWDLPTIGLDGSVCVCVFEYMCAWGPPNLPLRRQRPQFVTSCPAVDRVGSVCMDVCVHMCKCVCVKMGWRKTGSRRGEEGTLSAPVQPLRGGRRLVSKKRVKDFLPLFCGNVCVRGQSRGHSVWLCVGERKCFGGSGGLNGSQEWEEFRHTKHPQPSASS